MLSTNHRNAASVLPLPVGAQSSALRPAAISGQPRACTSVGSPSASPNQRRAAGEKRLSESITTMIPQPCASPAPLPPGSRGLVVGLR